MNDVLAYSKKNLSHTHPNPIKLIKERQITSWREERSRPSQFSRSAAIFLDLPAGIVQKRPVSRTCDHPGESDCTGTDDFGDTDAMRQEGAGVGKAAATSPSPPPESHSGGLRLGKSLHLGSMKVRGQRHRSG